MDPSQLNVGRNRARFEPPVGKRLLILGQDLSAIGGFKKPLNDGYVDHLPLVPGGVTTYASLPSLFGVQRKIDLWAGPLCAQCIIDNPRYQHSTLAIGLHMVDQEKKIADGKLDKQLTWLADWTRAARRPVFLRIGYEFDGSWNHYEPVAYKDSFRRIASILKERGATNVATVWQASTSPVNGYRDRDLNDWYPGNDVVDWAGFSWFLENERQYKLTGQLLDFATAHGKPVMACEAAPQGYDLTRLTLRDIASGGNPRSKTAEEIWDGWYRPFFEYLDANRETVKALAYINVNWDSQRMWGPPYRNGYWGDSRVQANTFIKEQWTKMISGEGWLNASPELFGLLGWA